jgi:hypothetical protein
VNKGAGASRRLLAEAPLETPEMIQRKEKYGETTK